jgi:hypothetical protein
VPTVLPEDEAARSQSFNASGLELLERLAAITPRPRINLVLYYGVLAAHAAWRPRLPMPGAPAAAPTASSGAHAATVTAAASAVTGGMGASSKTVMTVAERRGSNWLWAELMRRSFGFDVLGCPRCGGRLQLIAVIEQAAVVRRILTHLGVPADVPAPRPARPPPATAWTPHFEPDFDTP